MATSAGSILDNGTKAAPGVLYYGGGGGGGSTFASASISSLTVSSINGAAPGGSSGPAIATSSILTSSLVVNGPATASTMNVSSIVGNDGGFLTVGGTTMFVKTQLGMYFPSDGAIVFQDNLGALTGVSSINGAPIGASGLPTQTAPLANGGNIVLVANSVGGPQPITGSFATTAGKLYQASIKVTAEDLNPAGPPPTAGDHYAFVDPTAGIAATRTYAEISSIKGAGQPYGETVYFNFIANGPTAQLSAYNNIGTTQSTLVTLDTTYQCRVVQLD